LAVGDTVGRCLLTEPLGRGSSSAVFRALHQGLNVSVAVKVLQFDAGVAPHHAYEQLRTEARLLAQLSHPHIVRVLDFEEDPAQPYLVLEMIEGPSLSELIRQSGRLSLERTCEVIGQTADGLAAVWELGAVHRDVKPGNILLTRGGAAKLADLGTAVLLEDLASGDELEATTDPVSGTAAYLAPEQFLAPSTVDRRADIYALGATFYEAVTGRRPFDGRSRADVMIKHAKDKPIPPHELVPELGPRISEVLLTMLAKDPDDRYQNVEELRQAFAWLAGTEREPERPSQTKSVVEEAPVAAAASPRRRSFWKALLPDFRPRPADNEAWLHLVKRTLNAAPRKKG
jgi:serine/threonine protein kinase